MPKPAQVSNVRKGRLQADKRELFVEDNKGLLKFFNDHLVSLRTCLF